LVIGFGLIFILWRTLVELNNRQVAFSLGFDWCRWADCALPPGAGPLGAYSKGLEMKVKAGDMEDAQGLKERIRLGIPRLHEFLETGLKVE
jgi:hypothetical protein